MWGGRRNWCQKMEMNWGKQMLKICTTGFNATSRNEELLKEVVATNPGQRRSLEIQFLRKKLFLSWNANQLLGNRFLHSCVHTKFWQNCVFVVLHLFIICLFVYALVLHGNVRYCMLTMMVMTSLHNRSGVSPVQW